MKNSNAITVVIPTYKRPDLIKRAVISAINQSYKNIIINIHDNSEDIETEKILQTILTNDKRVRYFRNKRNLGSIQNFSFGIEQVETDFFCIISDDDFFLPNFFEKAITTLVQTQADFICCQTIAINEKFQVISGADQLDTEGIYNPGEAIDGMIYGGVPCKWSGIIFKKAIKNQIKLNINAGPYADAGFVLHAAARFKCVTKKLLAAVYVTHQFTASATTSTLELCWRNWWEEMILDIECDEYVPLEVRRSIRKKMYPNFKIIAINQLKNAVSKSDPLRASKIISGLEDIGYRFTSKILKIIFLGIMASRLIKPLLEISIRNKNKENNFRINKLTNDYSEIVSIAKQVSYK